MAFGKCHIINIYTYMFILRRITSHHIEINTSLGSGYVLIDAEKNPKDYQEQLKIMKWSEDNDIYGFISHNEGADLIPLYKKSTYFIMTGSGKTFDNLTFK